MRTRVLLISLRSDVGGGPQHVMDLIDGFRNSSEVDLYIAAPNDAPFGPEYSRFDSKYFKLQ